jgi:hypothetical protein
MLVDLLIVAAMLVGAVALVYGLSLAITSDEDARSYPGRLPDDVDTDDWGLP